MKLLLLLFSLLSISFCDKKKDFDSDQNDQITWNRYKNQYKKEYRNNNEEKKRQSIYQTNLNVIQQHNQLADSGFVSFRLATNEFADLTDAEYAALLTGLITPTSTLSTTTYTVNNNKKYRNKRAATTTIPPSINWNKTGAVTEVIDQGSCGACWAFSATAALEAQYFKKTGKLVKLSEQNLIDCSRPQGNKGCSGGWMGYAFQYIISNRGINSNASYPYTMNNSLCQYNPAWVAATQSGMINIASGNEAALKQAVAQIGPVSVGIDGSLFSFRFYSSGVFSNSSCSKTNLNHAVTVVGYDSDPVSGLDYYIIKNSWGTSWGMKGFGYIARNKNNMCGIATAAVYPKI